MKNFTIAIIVGLVACFSHVNAQTTISGTSKKIYLDFKANVPATIQLLKPDFATSRGFKASVSEALLEVEGIVRDEDGVQSLWLNETLLDFDGTGYFRAFVPMTEGENNLVFEVIDFADESTGKSFLVDFVPERVVMGGKYYSLIIAINDYQDDAILDLDHPINDASALYEVLTQDYTFDQENSQLLTNPTRSEIIDGLDDLSRKVTDQDNVLIFYAGHGYWDETAEIGYWLPSDSRKGRKSAWFRNSTLRDYIKEIDSKNTLLIADACFGGAIFKSRSAFMSDASIAISAQYETKSRKAMTSGTLSEVPDKSVFMKYMLKRLSANQEKYLATQNLFVSFKDAVINNAILKNNIPQYGSVQNAGDEGGDFIFIKKD